MAQEQARSGNFTIVSPKNSAMGPGALVINNLGSLPLEWKRPEETQPQYLEKAIVRADELAEVHERLQPKTGAASASQDMSGAIWGAPGVGKSTLAALYAERYQEQYPGGVLWLLMGPQMLGAESVNPSLNRIAAYAYRADAQIQSMLTDVVFSPEAVRSLLSGHGPLLMVADDVWDRAILDPLRRALPAGGHLLVTTRNSRVAHSLGAMVELDVLKPADALEYVGRPLSWGPDGQARRLTEEQQQQLIKAVGRHPLALAIALADLAEREEDERPDCIAEIGRMVAEGQGFGDLPLLDEVDRESRVEVALRYSYEAMGPEFQRRFRALGCMAQEADFDTEAAAVLWDDDETQARKYLDVLVARALLKHQRQPGRWQQHSILRAYALNLQSPEARQELALAHAKHYRVVALASHEAIPRDYERLEREFPQVAHAFSLARKDNHAWGSVLVQWCDDFLRIRGQLSLLRTWLQAALAISDAHADRLGKAYTLQSLGDLESRLGNVDAARQHYDAALPLFEAEQDRVGKANTLRSLGDLERRLGNLDAARQHYNAALPLYEAEQSRLGKANTLRSLGDLESSLGNLDAARQHYNAALPLYEAEQSRLGKANTLKSLGDLERQLGNLDAARQHYGAALPLFEAEREPIGPMNINISLARLECSLGNIDQADTLYRRVLNQAQQLPGFANHPMLQAIQEEYRQMHVDAEQAAQQ